MWKRKRRGGQRIIRHKHQKAPELAVGDPALMEAVEAHVGAHFGEVEFVWHELVSMHVHVDVLVVEPAPGRPVKVLVTCGMSQRRMKTRGGGPRWAELMMMVPEGFDVVDEETGRPSWSLPLLQRLAHIPHDFDTSLGYGHTIPNGDPAEPYADTTEMCCALIGESRLSPDGFDTLAHDGHEIAFFAVYPLLPAEVDLKLRDGAAAVFDRLDAAGVTEVLHEDRAGVA